MKIFSFYKGRILPWYTFVSVIYLCCYTTRANPTLLKLPNQQQQITGTITDGVIPLAGVTIKVKGTTTSVVSDFDGKYAITANTTDILIFSYLGYKTLDISIGNRKIIDVKMLDNTTSLQEVTVNAGYYSVKNSERTGSIAKITSKDIEKQPVTNILATMQGRMAGVEIIQDGGTAGGAFQIKIRGQNSLRTDGNSPLYIIDGVPYSSETIGSTETSTITASQTSPLNSINPADIESIEVLKDADATAIYGSRGANGVVLITTKKGKAGKTTVTITASSGIGKVTKMLDLMNTTQYLEMRRQAFVNDGITVYPNSAYDINGAWDQNRYTDWQKELIGGTAQINNTQLGIAGGSSSTQYLLSGNYRTETTVFPGNFGYNKGAVHFSMNHVSDDKKFKLTFSGGYTSQKNNQPSTDLTGISRSLAPNAPALYDIDGNLNWENNTFENPLASLISKGVIKTNDLLANAVLSYEIIPGLEFKTNLGFTDLKNNEVRTMPSTMYNPAYGIGSSESILLTNTTLRQSWIIEPQLRWNRTFTNGKMDILIGATAQQQKNNRLYQMGYGFASNSLINDLSSANSVFTFTSDETVYRYQAFFGRINYNWQKRFIVNLTGRRDGSSRFGPGKQFAVFGAVGAAWLFSNEKFLKENNSILSFGKLRTSYGTTGNDQIGDYQFLNTYTSAGTPYQGTIGLNPVRLFNPDFGWEINKKFEAALETGFFQDRVFLTTAWYLNRSSNQLVGIPLPGTTGFSSVNANLDATVENTGIELTLRTLNIDHKNFDWTSNFNISASKNKLISFPGLEASTYANNYVIGSSLNITKVFHYTGLNTQTGIYEFEDVNGDGLITADKDRKTVADLTPQYFGGIQNQFRFKNLQLDFLFQFVKQKNYDYIANVPAGAFYNQTAAMTNSWQQSGDNTPYQQSTTGTNGEAVTSFYNYRSSDAAIVDGSYIRLKNISLSYDLPLKMDKNLKCRLFFQGQNLMTFTSYKGGDPEFKYAGYLPPLKMYTVGVQLTF
ncbi:SusC/RagA family TonB-linked outer membrane protein [Flavobacterium cupreum]|uniref:SusC/RagA family TonB-linked outer membrane protein n=2 Tax=Flavobacterium TaxID=237 RepID=A0A4Y7UG80_9FLAO|nr:MULTISPECIES: SusC/RagA family TonB-linked outer membrane protein [Flavobacterium]RUT71533.1 SusC/RagA family TonB-linked outer membrane protein [Flavobacterium cupreum]TCN59637.1 TonB-linked SusC/RagA family outer membrane protein [Flavobacterium circumlabens]TEB44908.1 SusC/RagA family TonB-linked outer membrane protein [Flavobacterium circumlabens]